LFRLDKLDGAKLRSRCYELEMEILRARSHPHGLRRWPDSLQDEAGAGHRARVSLVSGVSLSWSLGGRAAPHFLLSSSCDERMILCTVNAGSSWTERPLGDPTIQRFCAEVSSAFVERKS
jgi:hypothetical protein